MNKMNDNSQFDAKAECRSLVEQFINFAYPQLAPHIGDPEFEQALMEVEAEGTAAFQETINLESYGLPLTAIEFYYIYIKGTCMMGVGAVINSETVEIEYKWFGVSMQDLSLTFTKEETRDELINTLKEQIDKVEI